MCQAKPGTRCSLHAKKRLEAAESKIRDLEVAERDLDEKTQESAIALKAE